MSDQNQFIVPVEGMTCDHCERTVEKAIKSAGGQETKADFQSGLVYLKLATATASENAAELERVVKSIRAVGYRPGEPQPVPSIGPNGQVEKANERFDYDLLVIGSGGAAFAASIKATEMGKRVLMVERGVIGGTCVNIGCVPSKTLLRAAETFYTAAHHPFKGVETRAVGVNLAQIVAQKNELVGELRAEKYEDLIESYGWQLERGEAHFVDAQTVEVNGKAIRAESFLIATGASPAIPAIAGLEEAGYLTSTSALELKEVPGSLAIIGSGYIALELGQFFHHLGVQVTLMQRSSRILKGYDPEIAQVMQEVLDQQGLRVLTGAQINRVEKTAGGKRRIIASVNGHNQTIEVDQILVATGRKPNTAALQLQKAGVKTDGAGAILVNDELRTSNPHIWAAGDVRAGALQYVYVAAYEGALVAENALEGAGRNGRKVDLSAVPAVTFTTPAVATVGLTEAQAQAAGFEVITSTLPLTAVPRALINHDVTGAFKLVVDAVTRQVLGVHIVAENAGDVIYAGTLAVKARLSVEDLTSTFAPYLTMAEGIKLAAQTFNRDVSKLSCCAA